MILNGLNSLDNLLFAEFEMTKPHEQTIRHLIAKGANINAIDSKGESVLINAISFNRDIRDYEFIQLFVDLGGDINCSLEGFNCLFDAALTEQPELVEMLLKAGANPNCISSHSHKSLLNWAEGHVWHLETEGLRGVEPMKKTVQLLKNYGAKCITEIFADKPEKFLIVFATYNPTGIFTLKGNLKPENMPNADKNFVDAFTTWAATNLDKWDEYEYDDKRKIINPPDFSVLRQHNAEGLELAKEIRKMVFSDIEVQYYFVNPDDFEKNRVRNVEDITITEDK